MNGRMFSTIAGAGALLMSISTFAFGEDAKPAETAAYSFRNLVFVKSDELKKLNKPWSMVEGNGDQDVVASFILKENGVEKALVGISRMDELFTTPERMKIAAKDMKASMEKMDKKNEVTVTENVKLTTKNGEMAAIKMDFSKQVDDKTVSIYLLCVPAGEGVWKDYAVQVSVQDAANIPDAEALIKLLEFKPQAK
jgi:hypothetical protein